MEASKALLQTAIASLKSIASAAAAAVSEGAPLLEQKKDLTASVRNATAHVVAIAHLVSAGPETIRRMIGDSFIKTTGDVLKVRLSEANKIRRLHQEFDTLAALWAEGTAESFDEEQGGYSVSKALKDVAKPADPMAGIAKAVLAALAAGIEADKIAQHVTVTVKQYEVEQEFLADSEESEVQQQHAA